jgi:mercuric ion transport protein
MTSQAEDRARIARPEAGRRIPRTQTLATVGGLLGALAASSCCVVPLLLFALGVSGAWISNLTRLAPYQPYFIAVTLGCLGYGYWLVYRSRKTACGDDQACTRPLSNRIVTIGLVLATVVVIGALTFDVVAPLFYS